MKKMKCMMKNLFLALFQLDDDAYFDQMKAEIAAKERAKLQAELREKKDEKEAKATAREETKLSVTDIANSSGKLEDHNAVQKDVEEKKPDEQSSNKRRADNPPLEKEPTKKKSKESKKKKVLAMGGVSMFGGKDIFGGKNPFAARKQEESTEDEEDEEEEEELAQNNGKENGVCSNVIIGPSHNIAVQADAEEKPVSFDDIPTNIHVISSSNKHRVTLPSKRRPPARSRHSGGQIIF